MRKNACSLLEITILFLFVLRDYLIHFFFNNIEFFKVIYRSFFILLLILIIINYFIVKIERKEWALILLYLVLTILAYDYEGFLVIILAFSLKRISIKEKIIKVMNFHIFFSMILVISSLIGIHSGIDRALIRNERIRMSLGFANENALSSILILICLGSVILQRKKQLFLTTIISLILYYLTQSRTILIIPLISLIPWGTIKRLNFSKFKFNLVKYIFYINGLLSYYLIYFFTLSKLNKLLSNRLFYGFQYITSKKITLFGNKHFLMKEFIFPIDNSYIYILIEKGIIIYTLYGIIYYFLFKKCEKNLIVIGVLTIQMFLFLLGKSIFTSMNITLYFMPLLFLSQEESKKCLNFQ